MTFLLFASMSIIRLIRVGLGWFGYIDKVVE